MRLIWKKRWGFTVISYPIDQEENLFRVGVYDGNGDLWWYSETSSDNELILEEESCKGWINILTDFGQRHENFPTGQPVLDAQKDILSEVQITQKRLQELLEGESSNELSRTDDGNGRSTDTGGEEENSQEEKDNLPPLHTSGTEEDGGENGDADGTGGESPELPSESPGSQHLDSEEGNEHGEESPEEGGTGHSEAPDKSEDSNQEAGTVTG